MNITVYLGSYDGNDEALRAAVAELGKWIGASGNTLVYGGSKIGTMGVLAESVIKSGGKAIGVEPRFFVEKVLQYDDLTELIVTENMSDRKAKMIELGDAFIALPGGTGTLEEISEIMSQVSLGLIDAPCIIYNFDHYYDSLQELLDTMIWHGLSTKERQTGIRFAESLEEIIQLLTSEGEA